MSKKKDKPRTLAEIRKRPLVLTSSQGWGGYASFNRWGSAAKPTMGALCELFMKMDRILAGRRHRDINVMVKDTRTPSETDGTTIYFSKSAVTDAVNLGREHLMSIFGLNYHELAHILYTPRVDDGTKTWLLEGQGGRAVAFNILEDARIEHLIRQRYPKTWYYFLAAVYKYFYDVTENEFQKNWYTYISVAERRYVPRQDRQDARDVLVALKGESVAQQVEDIEAEYVRMVNLGLSELLPARARYLIEEMAKIISESYDPTGGPAPLVAAARLCKDQSHTYEGGAGAKKTPTGALEDAGIYIDLDEDDDEGLISEGAEGRYEDSKQRGFGRGYSKHGSHTAIFLEDEALTNVQISNDLQHAKEVISKAQFTLEDLASDNWRKERVTAPMRKARDQFADRLQALQAKVDPGWERETPSGRINLKRYLDGGDLDTVFDTWNDDQSDAVTIEVKVLLDLSTSMSGTKINEMSKALWVIASAIDSVNGKLDLIGYSDGSYALRKLHDKEDANIYRKYGVIGGTNPRVGIAKSRHDFTNSDARNKLFVLLTDGGWEDPEDDEDIRDMNALGVTTVLVWIGDTNRLAAGSEETYSHQCQHWVAVTRGDQLSDFVKRTVTGIMRSSIKSIGR